MHVGLLTYPPEGATVQIAIQIYGDTVANQTVDVPAGSAPLALNISCAQCYTEVAQMTVFIAYASDPSTSTTLDQDSLAITQFSAEDDYLQRNPTHITASFSGVTVGNIYSLSLWCDWPSMVDTTQMVADVADLIADYYAQPAKCETTRYLVISSADGIHMAVAET